LIKTNSATLASLHQECSRDYAKVLDPGLSQHGRERLGDKIQSRAHKGAVLIPELCLKKTIISQLRGEFSNLHRKIESIEFDRDRIDQARRRGKRKLRVSESNRLSELEARLREYEQILLEPIETFRARMQQIDRWYNEYENAKRK